MAIWQCFPSVHVRPVRPSIRPSFKPSGRSGVRLSVRRLIGYCLARSFVLHLRLLRLNSHKGENREAIEISDRPIAITHANPAFWHQALRNKKSCASPLHSPPLSTRTSLPTSAPSRPTARRRHRRRRSDLSFRGWRFGSMARFCYWKPGDAPCAAARLCVQSAFRSKPMQKMLAVRLPI